MNTTDPARPESHLWLVPTGANQAADVARLASLSGRVTDVRYSILDRESAFLLRGDLAQGLPAAGDPIEALQLPALAAGATERTEDVMAFDPRKWRSVRVYDRGICSSLQSWQSVSQQFAEGFAQQIQDTDGVRGVELRSGGLTPMLRADFPTNDVTPPDDTDGLSIHYRFHADAIHKPGHPALGCRPVDADLDIELWLEPTDRAYMDMDAAVFALGCYLGADLETYRAERDGLGGCEVPPPVSDARWLDPGQAKQFVSQIRACDGGNSFGPVAPLAARMQLLGRSVRNELEAGRPIECNPDAQLGYRFADMDYQLRQRHLLSGLDRADDEALLFGVSRIEGQDLGAHDTLAHIVEAGLSSFPSRHCTRGTVGRIRSLVHKNIARALVLGFGEAIRGAARLSPEDALLAGLGRGRSCTHDYECNFSAQNGPAFQDHSGGSSTWRGARHACQVDRCAPNGPSGVCVAQLEPDHLNFRPDGLEVVLDWDASLDTPQDPQVVVYRALASVVDLSDPTQIPNECDVRRAGYLPFDHLGGPNVIRDEVPFAITPVVATDPATCPPVVTERP